MHLIKTARSRPHTAAIGDGGNDVSMIQQAHVGIGILGKEGRQAAISADFAFTKFKYLRKALLVHGHWYYLRISILMQFFFYKNVVFITPQVLFGIHNGFSCLSRKRSRTPIFAGETGETSITGGVECAAMSRDGDDAGVYRDVLRWII